LLRCKVNCMIVALQGCVIVALQGCVIVVLQGCVIVLLRARFRDFLQDCVIAQCTDSTIAQHKPKLKFIYRFGIYLVQPGKKLPVE
jgi:hypothetical protein